MSRAPFNPRGSRQVRDRMNRDDLLYFLRSYSVTLITRKRNAGEWNECRDYYFGDRFSGFTFMKGERVDYDALYRAAEDYIANTQP